MNLKAIVDKDDKIIYYIIKYEESKTDDFMSDFTYNLESIDKLTKEEFIFDLKNNKL